MKKVLLLTGASGFLGWNIMRLAAGRYDITGIVNAHRADFSGVRLLPCNLCDRRATTAMFSSVKPDAVIHCAALSDPNWCEVHREESRAVNVDATINLAALCAGRKIPFVFTSSDLVFDGLQAPYRENDAVCPVSVYGAQKAKAEFEVLARYPDAAICRMPLMFGESGPAAKSFIQPMIRALREGKELNLFVDEFRTPASGETAAAGLLLVLEKGLGGIIHLGGRERISRFAFGRELAAAMGIAEARIVAVRQQDVTMAAKRPPDVSLVSDRAFDAGYDPKPIKDELQRLRQLF